MSDPSSDPAVRDVSGSRCRPAGALALLVSLLLVLSPAAFALDWDIEWVDDAMNRFGSSVGVAVASDGTPHIVNGAHPSLVVRYGVKQQGEWLVSDADSGWSGQGAAIALDPAGNPWLAYMKHTDSDWLTVARWTGSTWEHDNMIADMHYDKRCSIQLSAEGLAHVAFCESDDPWALRHAWKPADTWLVETADPTVGAGNDIGMVLDGLGNPQISHFAAPNHGAGPFYMKYTWWDGTVWADEVFDPTIQNHNVIQSGIGLDAEGNPHITYFTHTDFPVLRYAVRRDGQWTITTIDSNLGWFEGAACGLVLDRLDRPHVIYGSMYAQVGGWSELRYAHRDLQGAWVIEVVDGDGDAGELNSVALDPQGYLHIAYFRGPGQGQDGEIRYARSRAPVLPCPGDVDGDDDTDLADLAALLAAYGSSVGDPNYNPYADFDRDGDIDLSDLAFLLSDYGCGG